VKKTRFLSSSVWILILWAVAAPQQTEALLAASPHPAASQVAQPSGGEPSYSKSPGATQRIPTPVGNFAIWVDPANWHQTPETETGLLSFSNAYNSIFAKIITEKVPFPTDTLKELALVNAQKADPNAHKMFEEKRIVNGHEIVCLKIEANVKNIPVVYYGYYFGGTSGAIQVVTFTFKSLFADTEPRMLEFLNGLEINDTPALATTTTASPEAPGSTEKQPHASQQTSASVVATLTGGEPNYSKSPGATQRIPTPVGNYAIWIDPTKWHQTPPTEGTEPGRLSFETADTIAHAMVITEKLPFPTDTLKELALVNAQKADPNAHKTFEEKRIVNGREIVCMKIEANIKGLPFVYYSYYFGGTSGAIQVVTFTLKGLFADAEPGMLEFLNGLEINDTPVPATTTAESPEGAGTSDIKQLTFNDGKFVVSYDARKWQNGKTESPGRYSMEHIKGAGYALIITESIEVPMEALPDIAVGNAKDAAPDAQIVFKEKRVVHGVELYCLKIQGTIKEVPFIYYGYYYSGKGGTIQLLTYTTPPLLGDYEQDFTELLNGLEIRP
jgi:hypothetical protein